jgi:hypothetical protein
MIVVWIVVGVVAVGGFVALFLWSRSVESEVDFKELAEGSTQTDEQRRAKQLGIGLTSGGTMGGPQ